MRYYYERPKQFQSMYGETYICNHSVYNRCTLFNLQGRGIAVIQQRYDSKTKHTYWTEIDNDLTDVIYLNPNFLEFFNSRADYPNNYIYPTVTIRQIMHALKMKPLKKERWETVFDRREI